MNSLNVRKHKHGGKRHMEYTKLGNTDIEVSKLCVGCMSFGKAGTMHDWTLDEKQTDEMVAHALDLGINFFDTANGYSAGTSEEYLGKALKNHTTRDKVVIAFDEVEEYIGHAPGGVCPFGIKDGIKVYLDESLKCFEMVYPAAGNDHSAVRLTIAELEDVAGACGWIDVCKEM